MRRAEEDKVAAITALEARSREYLMEKEEKRKLEEKIKMMNSQMLIGGKKIEETPQFRVALEEKQRQIREEYEHRLQEIERERNQIEEDKTQVDRYKQLLVKQRDIMIALTARLNARDETIIQLQEELDAYARIHRESEMQIESKQERVAHLEKIVREVGVELPPELEAEGDAHAMGGGGARRYLPFNQEEMQLSEGDAQVALQLLTADEKVSELSEVVEQQRQEIGRLQSAQNDKIELVRD